MDKAIKKLFAIVSELEKKLARLDNLERRLASLDTDGKLDDLKKEMAQVAANSRMVVTQVEANGNMIANMEKTISRLNTRCPLMKPDTDGIPKASKESKCEDE